MTSYNLPEILIAPVRKTVTQIMEEFDLTSFGFLTEQPVGKLDDDEFKDWELLMEKLPKVNASGDTRNEIMKLSPFEWRQLQHPWQVKRAYLILTLLTNSYVWCQSPPVTILPAQLAIPLSKVSEQLGIAPILTHASVDLYNWELINSSEPFHLDNLKSINLMTGTDSEEWFYLIMVAIEHVGGSIINCILNADKYIYENDSLALTLVLDKMDDHLIEICKIIVRMKDRCEPEVFWNVFRPYLSGWKSNDDLPTGLVYEGVSEKPLELYGGSAAQSSLFAVIDSSLGVTHHDEYFNRIMDYMPIKHKNFTDYVRNNINIKTYVESSNDTLLTETYDRVIKTLTKFRQLHFGLVHRYIIKMAKKDKEVSEEASTEENTDSEKGTGGTELGTFLKVAINETKDSKFTN